MIMVVIMLVVIMIVPVGVVVPMFMGVIVRMVMVMIVVVAMIVGVIVPMLVCVCLVVTLEQVCVRVLVGPQQLLDAHLLVDGLGQTEDVLDDLVLEDGRAQLDQGGRVLLVIFVDHLLLARIAPRLLDKG